MSKADDIRRLLAEGKTRSETARLAGTSYQQVYQIDVKRKGGSGGTYARRVAGDKPAPRHGRGWYYGRNEAPDGGGRGPELQFPTAGLSPSGHTGQERYPIRTGPYQTRIATQDGHEVRLTSDIGGKMCANCKGPIQYSIRELAYVHAGSKEPVTSTQDVQTGPGFFDHITRKLPS